MMPATTILLVDDETSIRTGLRPVLERAGFEVLEAADGLGALETIKRARPDLIVLDIMLPGIDGREVIRRLRTADNWTPVIMLTQVNSVGEKILSFAEGADDYLNKPFDSYELIARIQALLRRVRRAGAPLSHSNRLQSGDLLIDRNTQRAYLGDRELPLARRAFAVLAYLMSYPDEIIGRERLLDNIWGWDYAATPRTVDVRIAELRRALHDDASQPRYIETVVGEGYRFIAEVTPA